MKYSCHVYNNFIWFWYDLNGTNPDWRCFEQTCHGVIFVQKEKFSEWPETSQRIFLELIKNTGKRIKTRGPTPCPRGWGARPPASWAPWCSTDLNSNSIYSRSGRKKIREKDSSRFMIRSRRQALISLGRADPESVRGSGEGRIRRCCHHQPSSITSFMMLTVVRE